MKKTLLTSVLAAVAALTPPAAKADRMPEAWTTDYPAIEASIRAPQFAAKTYDITKFGAQPEGSTKKLKKGQTLAALNQKAINTAIEKCSKAGGGTVVVPDGVWETGAIRLLSNVNLHLNDNATLRFAFDPALYPVVPTRWEGLDCHNLSPCIYAYKETNVGLTGKGTVDGGGSNETWWPWCGKDHYGWSEGKINQNKAGRPQLLKQAEDGVPMAERVYSTQDGLRPQLVNFNQCDGVLIEDVTLLDSPFWVIHPLLCKNVTVRGVTINNDGPNGDGCDPESCDGVLIENCYFNTGDDCIAIKSGRNNDGRLWDLPSQNIIIRNCEMKNGHGGVVIGSEITGGARNIFAENNVMDSPSLDRVVRIKTNPCRGGTIENIYVRNTTVGQCGESVLKINLDYEPREACYRGYPPTVRNVYLNNVTCNKSKYGLMIVALPEVSNVYNINLTDCDFKGVDAGNNCKGLYHDVNYDNLLINGSLVLNEAPYKNYSQWMANSEMKRIPDSGHLDFGKAPKWSYAVGIELESILDTYLKYGDKPMLDYCKSWTDQLIDSVGTIRGYNIADYNLDMIRPGHFLAKYHFNFPEEKNAKAMATLMKQLEKQPRTQQGVYWHKAIYSYQVWLDGIFMGMPYSTYVAANTYKPKEAKKIFDDAVDQLKATYEKTYDAKTGLNRHAWDENRDMFWSDDETGLSQHCWGRAQGWYSMALIEILDAMPEDYARRGEVVDLLGKTLSSVKKWQDKKSGVWYQVMDSPEREGNYLEATCSSMFAYAMLKAARLGYVGDEYRKAGEKAYRGIIDNFIRINPDSTISLTDCCAVAGLGPGVSPSVLAAAPNVKENKRRDGSFEYYLSEPIRDNDSKGVGPFIWASLEMEHLGHDTASLSKF